MQFVIGSFARLVFWFCFLMIVGNAVIHAIDVDQAVYALAAVIVAPITFLVWPFIAPEGASAWPFADGTSLIVPLVIAVIAYPISTVIGGLDPVD